MPSGSRGCGHMWFVELCLKTKMYSFQHNSTFHECWQTAASVNSKKPQHARTGPARTPRKHPTLDCSRPPPLDQPKDPESPDSASRLIHATGPKTPQARYQKTSQRGAGHTVQESRPTGARAHRKTSAALHRNDQPATHNARTFSSLYSSFSPALPAHASLISDQGDTRFLPNTPEPHRRAR